MLQKFTTFGVGEKKIGLSQLNEKGKEKEKRSLLIQT